MAISFRELVPVLQVAIGPVILISGVGLLLLSLTNRFGRAVDRSRALGRELRQASAEDIPKLRNQVAILFHRARVIQFSITMAACSVLLAALLIIVLFVSALRQAESGLLVVCLFTLCLVSLIVSLAAFLLDIRLSLNALRVELDFPPGSEQVD